MDIDSELKFDDLVLIKHLKSVDSPFVAQIQKVYDQVKDVLNTRVQRVFSEFTLHNTQHSFRIMEYMGKLVYDYTKLTELEIALLIYSALLHDIGMAVSEEDIAAIKSDSFQFCEVKFSAMLKIKDNDESLALQEYVRRIHASLSSRYILDNLQNELTIPKPTTLNFAKELALICKSHTEDFDWIKSNLKSYEVKGDYAFNSQYIASILRLADILDIDGNRTPYNLYKLISPKGFSDEEWRKHFVVSNNDKINVNEKTGQKKIVFHGKCENPSIHRKLLDYIEWVKNELTNATALVNNMQPQYNLFYDPNPEVNIQTEGYTFSDYKMTLEYKAISSLLMGEKIYGNKSLGLRELVQNSIDACRVRQESVSKSQQFGDEPYIPRIKVILDREKNQVTIKDNGSGMSHEIIKKNFLNIGVSYYNSMDFLLNDFEYHPIGNYGIGFLSCFMLSDEVTVHTRHYLSKDKYTIQLEKGDEWSSLTQLDDLNFNGTEVILNYDSFMEVFENKLDKVKEFMNEYFITDNVFIELLDKPILKTVKIVNPLNQSPSVGHNLIKIELKNYLKDIEGYVVIESNDEFVKSIEDISFKGNLYIYNDFAGLQQIDEIYRIDIDDYIEGNEIKYLNIPIIGSRLADDFSSGMNFTDGDIEEVLSKLENRYMMVSVIVPKYEQSSLVSKEIYKDDLIFEKLSFNDLIELGHDKYCRTMTYVDSINLFEGIKNKLYLPFSVEQFPYRLYLKGLSNSRELFIRDVLISDFSFVLPRIASVFEIKSIVVNINSRKIIPNISRNNVDSKTRDMLNYVIGKAIHIGASKLLPLDDNEKQTLNNFIDLFYGKQTGFER